MRRALLSLAALLIGALPLSAQTADEIVARYVQAVGGMERIQAVRTVRRTGTYYGGGGFEARMVEENKRPNMIRQEITFGGMTGATAYDGKTGWKTEPWGGKKDAEALGEEELKAVIEDADIDGPLVNYQQKGNKVEYLGIEPVEGSDSYKLKVTLKSGDVLYYYIDTEYNVPIKVERKRIVRGAEREYESILGDYKQVSGWYLPFAVESAVKGSPLRQRVVYDAIVANVPVDDGRFAKPGTGAEAPASAPDAAAAVLPPAPPAAVPSTAASAAPVPPSGPVKVDSETISGLGARNIGSAVMSGRIAALAAVHEGARLTVYVGAASGGLWKSVNGGTSYKPVFDKQPAQSIGAIAIDPTNPKVVWVGTGEPWTRNSVSIGNGVYKTTDGGDNWTFVGLPESERIAKIVVDPTTPDTVYVCAPGKLWSDSEERGVFRTTDGGKTWTKVLAGGNPSTGCSMMAMDRKDPKVLYAGMWDFRRRGWTFRSGGEGPGKPSNSGLFKSTDGGATWTSLDAKSAPGLPAKPWGRIAVSVAPSNPSVVYAFVEAEVPDNALYRSADGGKTWEKKDRSFDMVWRPFYFANLIVDPKDENKLYKPDLGFIASTDGGSSFTSIGGNAHGDFHDLWIDPQNTDHMIVGDDGGVFYTYDGGNKWWKADNLPVSQFYHVSVDMERPYNVYGGLQDNGSWVAPSDGPGGITNDLWQSLFFGDGFWMFVDPSDTDYVYAEAQGGEIGRINRKTHEIRLIKPLPQYQEKKLRCNWNSPIHVGKSGAVYLGCQFLFRTKDQGQSWERISPDLSTNDTAKQQQELSGGITVDNSAAEMHTTVYAVAESPLSAQVVWAGTDDGNLQVTRDGGKTWTNVVGNITGLPKSAWVSYVEAGHFAEGTAYATFDRHTFGDMTPYAYKTSDFGKTWKRLVAADAPVKGYAHVVREDLVKEDLLFLGTELGLWVSLDGGKQWAQYLGGNFPHVAVRDLAVHPRDHDLVIATHGRGIWIVDDISPLRALTPEVMGQEAAFVGIGPAVQRLPAFDFNVQGDAKFTGTGESDDAVITYYQRRRHVFGDLAIDVRDSSGKVVAVIPSSKRRGLNRVAWSMRMEAPKAPPAATAGVTVGPRLLPGTYTVTMTKDKNSYTAPVEAVADPRSTHSAADRQAQFALAFDVYQQFADMTYVVEKINGVRLALDERAGKLPAGDALAARLRAASAATDGLRKKIVATKEGGMITGEERLREFLTDLYFGVVFHEGKPTQAQTERAASLKRELADVGNDFDAWAKKELPGINAELAKKGLPPVEALQREAWEAAQKPAGGGGGGGGAAGERELEREGAETAPVDWREALEGW
jgi:photosystem II stability/assembly factor-like uncharacterized protein